MKRSILVVVALGASLLGACGGGDNKTDASNSTNATSAFDKNVANAAVDAAAASVCGSRSAVNVGAAYASALQNSGGGTDYTKLADGLRAARDAAPSEIKGDFSVLFDAELPFLQAMAKANGNYVALAQDPNFQAAAEKLGSAAVQKASANISAWFTSHCK